jgi:hypothetical protein
MSVPAAFAGRLTPHPRLVGAIRGIGTTIQMADNILAEVKAA